MTLSLRPGRIGIESLENQVGYLFRVGQSASRTYRRKRIVFPAPPIPETPHVEPGLPDAFGRLTMRQRSALVLIHVNGMAERDVADAMGISRAAVRTHAQRGLSKLRDGDSSGSPIRTGSHPD